MLFLKIITLLLVQSSLVIGKCNNDFEDGQTSLQDWKKTGTAFNNQPTYGDNPFARTKKTMVNQNGNYFIGTFEDRPDPDYPPGGAQRDVPTGTLTSPEFRINGSDINFLIGGGCDESKVRAELLIDGSRVMSATGKCHESMKRVHWPVGNYVGRKGRIRLIDNYRGTWGHLNFDDFRGDFVCEKGKQVEPMNSFLEHIKAKLRPSLPATKGGFMSELDKLEAEFNGLNKGSSKKKPTTSQRNAHLSAKQKSPSKSRLALNKDEKVQTNLKFGQVPTSGMPSKARSTVQRTKAHAGSTASRDKMKSNDYTTPTVAVSSSSSASPSASSTSSPSSTTMSSLSTLSSLSTMSSSSTMSSMSPSTTLSSTLSSSSTSSRPKDLPATSPTKGKSSSKPTSYKGNDSNNVPTKISGHPTTFMENEEQTQSGIENFFLKGKDKKDLKTKSKLHLATNNSNLLPEGPSPNNFRENTADVSISVEGDTNPSPTPPMESNNTPNNGIDVNILMDASTTPGPETTIPTTGKYNNLDKIKDTKDSSSISSPSSISKTESGDTTKPTSSNDIVNVSIDDFKLKPTEKKGGKFDSTPDLQTDNFPGDVQVGPSNKENNNDHQANNTFASNKEMGFGETSSSKHFKASPESTQKLPTESKFGETDLDTSTPSEINKFPTASEFGPMDSPKDVSELLHHNWPPAHASSLEDNSNSSSGASPTSSNTGSSRNASPTTKSTGSTPTTPDDKQYGKIGEKHLSSATPRQGDSPSPSQSSTRWGPTTPTSSLHDSRGSKKPTNGVDHSTSTNPTTSRSSPTTPLKVSSKAKQDSSSEEPDDISIQTSSGNEMKHEGKWEKDEPTTTSSRRKSSSEVFTQGPSPSPFSGIENTNAKQPSSLSSSPTSSSAPSSRSTSSKSPSTRTRSSASTFPGNEDGSTKRPSSLSSSPSSRSTSSKSSSLKISSPTTRITKGGNTKLTTNPGAPTNSQTEPTTSSASDSTSTLNKNVSPSVPSNATAKSSNELELDSFKYRHKKTPTKSRVPTVSFSHATTKSSIIDKEYDNNDDLTKNEQGSMNTLHYHDKPLKNVLSDDQKNFAKNKSNLNTQGNSSSSDDHFFNNLVDILFSKQANKSQNIVAKDGNKELTNKEMAIIEDEFKNLQGMSQTKDTNDHIKPGSIFSDSTVTYRQKPKESIISNLQQTNNSVNGISQNETKQLSDKIDSIAGLLYPVTKQYSNDGNTHSFDEEQQLNSESPSSVVKFSKLGCYADKQSPPRPLNDLIFDDQSRIDQPKDFHFKILRCAKEAKKRHFKVFGIQFYDQCWSDKNGEKTYDIDDTSTNCFNEKLQKCEESDKECVGGPDTNYVYRIEDSDKDSSSTNPISSISSHIINDALSSQLKHTKPIQHSGTFYDFHGPRIAPMKQAHPQIINLNIKPDLPGGRLHHDNVTPKDYRNLECKNFRVSLLLSAPWHEDYPISSSIEYRDLQHKLEHKILGIYGEDEAFTGETIEGFVPSDNLKFTKASVILKFIRSGRYLNKLIDNSSPQAITSAACYEPPVVQNSCPAACPSQCAPMCLPTCCSPQLYTTAPQAYQPVNYNAYPYYQPQPETQAPNMYTGNVYPPAQWRAVHSYYHQPRPNTYINPNPALIQAEPVTNPSIFLPTCRPGCAARCAIDCPKHCCLSLLRKKRRNRGD